MALFEQCEREKNETADAEVAKEFECNRKALEDDVWSWLMPSTGAAKDVCADELSEANVSKLNASSTCDGLRCAAAPLCSFWVPETAAAAHNLDEHEAAAVSGRS